MKKTALILALLFALTANAYCTDVVVSAMTATNMPFNPANIGVSDQTITVTATNGSSTVTSASLFPQNIVGRSGFQVSIGGSQYVVAGVASRSSLTLTTAFSGVTGSTSMTLYKFVLLRVYSDQSFTTYSGNPTSVTAAVTNGSTTVTSAALFPPALVGAVGTFAVLIDNVRYQVFYVGSTSSLTLTSPYTGSSGAAQVSFNSVSDVVQQGAVGSASFYKEIAVSILNPGAGNLLYYPSFILPATTDAPVNNTARYSLAFYNASGGYLNALYTCDGGVTQLALPPSTPTTFANWCSYSGATAILPDSSTYTRQQIDARFPSCTAGQSYYFAANGNIVSCLNFGSGLTLTGNTLTASGGGGSAVTDYRGAINVSKAPYSCVGDGVTSDQTCLASAITAAAAAGGKIVYIPAGTYLVTGLTVPGGVTIVGDGMQKTIIRSVSNATIISAVEGSGAYAFLGPTIRDLKIQGSSSGASQIGLSADDVVGPDLYFAQGVFENIQISQAGSHGLYVGNAFSSRFVNLYSDDNNGYPFYINSANMPSNHYESLYAQETNAGANAGFRIAAGNFICISCNGINASAAGSWNVILGQSIAQGDAANVSAFAQWQNSNFESARAGGIDHRYNSVSTFSGHNQFAGDASSSGAYIAMRYEVDTALFPPYFGKGTIDSSTIFANSPASFYTNSMPIHANDLPPLSISGQGPGIAGGARQTAYRNTTSSTTQQLYRSDAYFPIVSVTGTASYTNPGPKYFEVTCGSNCTLTLPWPGWYQPASEQIVVKNLSATAVVVTVNAASGGTIDSAGSYAMSTQYDSVVLMPNSTALDYRIAAESVSGGGITGTLTAPRIPVASGASTLTDVSGLEWDSGSSVLKSPGRFWGANNSAGAPTFAFSSDFSTGFYLSSAGNVGFASSGSSRMLLGNTLSLLNYGASTGQTGTLSLFDLDSSASVSLRSADTIASPFTLTLPNALPGSTLCLAFSTSGVGSFTACSGGSGSPGGSDTEVQFNQAGSFGGITGATSDGTNMTFGSANLRATRPRITTSLDDSAGNELLVVTATGSAVNELTLANAATGANPRFTASGGDSDVGFDFLVKGAGVYRLLASASGPTDLRLFEDSDNGSNYASLIAPASLASDFVLTLPAATDTLAGKATTDIFTNKTLTASSNVLGGVTMTLGSDADGDMYYRASGVLTRLPKGTALQQLRMNAGATAPEWATISGGGTITGSGSTGTIAKFTGSSAIGDSLLSESGSTVTTAGRQTITGLTVSTDLTNTVASLTANATFTKNNSNPRDFFGVLIKPTFNFGGSNSATIVNILEVDSVNTNVTGLTTNLLSLKYGGNIAFNVDSDGGITFANGVRQAFSPSTIVASLNVGQVAADPSSPVNGDVVYETNTNKFRCYENSAWVNCISSGANTALSNLASVAINTSLLSDTTLTDDLGSASFYWRRAYAGQYFADATISAVSGNQTINRALFSFVIGSGTTNAVITNSFVTTSSLVICTPQKKDATALTVSAEPASGSVTITTNAGATADMPVACIVYNQ